MACFYTAALAWNPTAVDMPNRAPWLDEFRREITEFPNGRHDDQVDSLSQFLKWQRGRSVPGVRVMKLTGY